MVRSESLVIFSEASGAQICVVEILGTGAMVDEETQPVAGEDNVILHAAVDPEPEILGEVVQRATVDDATLSERSVFDGDEGVRA
jgi:hypothetical protein